MKLLLGFTFCFLAVTCVFGEDCVQNSDCHNTLCADGHNAICEFPEDGGDGLCTCATSEACTTKDECVSPAHPELNCPDSQRHCYDASCICSRFPIGPGR